MFSLELPHHIRKKITLNYLKSAAMGFCSNGLKEFETTVVNNPLKFYCIAGPAKLVDKTNFGLVLYNHANFYGFEETTILVN